MVRSLTDIKTICLLEKDIVVLSLMESVLEDLGYRVLKGYSEGQAVIDFTGTHADLILLDHRLLKEQVPPGLHLKAGLNKLQIPIILTTIENQLNGIDPLIVTDVLFKPFSLNEVCRQGVILAPKRLMRHLKWI